MKNQLRRLSIALVLLTGLSVCRAETLDARIGRALPEQASVEPRQPRKLLIFSLTQGPWHESIPAAQRAFEMLGDATGAYTWVSSTDMAMFDPENLQQFDAVLFNNTTNLTFDDPVHRQALMDFVKGGKGVAGVHAATDNFQAWPEAGEMMGGYFDGHPWNADGRHWAVRVEDFDHPLNQAFAKGDFLIQDEIYQFRGPYSRDTHRVLLSLDMTDPRNLKVGGMHRSDNDYAISWIRRWGEGRVFYCSLGHNPDIFWNPMLLQHMLDGVQYALGDLEADDTPSAQIEIDPYRPRIRRYDHGYSSAVFYDLELAFQQADPAEVLRLEGVLLELLAEEEVTPAAKQAMARLLRSWGSEAAVAVLAPLLTDPELSHGARWALEANPSRLADRALLGALTAAADGQRAGLLSSLAARRTPQAVVPAARLMQSDDPELAEAAIRCLSRIGTPEAARALAGAPADHARAALIEQARVAGAERMLADGSLELATSEFRRILRSAHSDAARYGALRGLVLADPVSGVRILLTILQGEASPLQAVAAGVVGEVPAGERTTGLIAGRLRALPPSIQVRVLTGLALSGDREVIADIVALLDTADAEVESAVYQALGVLGGRQGVPSLIRGLHSADAEQAAFDSLTRIQGAGVSELLIRTLQQTDDARVQAKLAAVLGIRNDLDAVPVLMALWPQSEGAVRRAALEALGAMGSVEQMPALVQGLVANPDGLIVRELGGALRAIIDRERDADRAAAPIVAGLPEAQSAARVTLARLLSFCQGATALEALGAEMRAEDVDYRRALVNVLAAWNDDAVLPVLATVAGEDPDPALRILALRTYIRLASRGGRMSSDQQAGHLLRAFELAERDEERVAVLSALPQVGGERAIQLARQAQQDDALRDAALRALMRMDDRWLTVLFETVTASSSANPGDVGLALDRDPATRWGTQRPMQPGDWFLLDFGQERAFASVTLDAAGSPLDYPRGIEVQASEDGQTWETVQRIEQVSDPVLRIEFAEPVRARYLRFVQQGSVIYWWCIHRIDVELDLAPDELEALFAQGTRTSE